MAIAQKPGKSDKGVACKTNAASNDIAFVAGQSYVRRHFTGTGALIRLSTGMTLVLAVAACSATNGTAVPVGVNPGNRQSGTSGGVAVPGTVAFLHTDPSTVVFLQWPVTSSGLVFGTAKQDYITGSAGNETVQDSTGSFTGQVNQGGGVTFTFAGSWGTVYGTESATTLTVNVPQQGGGLQATTFDAATPDGYNSAVASLQDSVTQANQQAQEQAQQASQAQAQSKAEQALDSDLTALQDDGSRVAGAVGAIPAAQQAVSAASATADSKLAAEKAYSGPQADCYKLGSMEYDTNSAVYDLNSAVYGLAGKASDLDSAISALDSDISQAQKDEQGVHSTGGGIPSGADSQIAAAAKIVSSGNATEQQAQADGNKATQHGQDVSTAAGSAALNCNDGG